MNKGFKISWILILVLFVYSCKSSKEVKREVELLKKPESVIKNLNDSAFNFSAISLKASVSVNSEDQKRSFKSSLRIRNDEAIWASVTFLGIAGAKFLITEDSLKMVNYKDKDYVQEDFAKVVDVFNSNLINLHNLQAILLGNLVDVEGYQKLHMNIENGQYVISTLSDRKANKDWIEKKLQKMEKKLEKSEEKNTGKSQDRIERKYDRRPDKFDGLEIDITIDPNLNKVTQLRVRDYLLNGTITAKYSDFRATDAGTMPFETRLEIKASKDINIDIVYSKVSVLDEIAIPFSIPKKYERTKL